MNAGKAPPKFLTYEDVIRACEEIQSLSRSMEWEDENVIRFGGETYCDTEPSRKKLEGYTVANYEIIMEGMRIKLERLSAEYHDLCSHIEVDIDDAKKILKLHGSHLYEIESTKREIDINLLNLKRKLVQVEEFVKNFDSNYQKQNLSMSQDISGIEVEKMVSKNLEHEVSVFNDEILAYFD